MTDIYKIMFTTMSHTVADALEDLAWGKAEQAEARLKMTQKMMDELEKSWTESDIGNNEGD